MVVGEFVALLVKVTVPAELPAVVGVNVTLNVAVWLGGKINPEVTPLVVKTPPVTVTAEIVTFEFPLFVIVTF